jgi:hypothetical protein
MEIILSVKIETREISEFSISVGIIILVPNSNDCKSFNRCVCVCVCVCSWMLQSERNFMRD